MDYGIADEDNVGCRHQEGVEGYCEEHEEIVGVHSDEGEVSSLFESIELDLSQRGCFLFLFLDGGCFFFKFGYNLLRLHHIFNNFGITIGNNHAKDLVDEAIAAERISFID